MKLRQEENIPWITWTHTTCILSTARNAALQPALEALRSDTQQLYDRARTHEQQWPLVEAEMREAYKRFTPSSLLFTLTQSASKLHDQSESLANAFVEGLPLEIAVSQCFTCRDLYLFFSLSLLLATGCFAWLDTSR